MDIKFECQACDQPVVVDSCGAGETVSCPTCGATISIPAFGASAPIAGTRPAARTWGLKGMVLMLLCGAAIAFLGVWVGSRWFEPSVLVISPSVPPTMLDNTMLDNTMLDNTMLDNLRWIERATHARVNPEDASLVRQIRDRVWAVAQVWNRQPTFVKGEIPSTGSTLVNLQFWLADVLGRRSTAEEKRKAARQGLLEAIREQETARISN